MAGPLNIQDFTSKVSAMLNALPVEMTQVNAELATTALSSVRNRLTAEGIDGKGKKLGTYSDNPLPTFFFTGKGLGSGADQKFDAYVKRERKAKGKAFKGVSYKTFRELNNRETNFVNLSFSGETLNDLAVLESRQEGQLIVTVVASKDSIKKTTYDAKGQPKSTIGTGEVLEHLGTQYGDILALTEKEEEDIAIVFDQRLQLFIDRYLQ
jgi:hypothetical protein